MREMKCEQPLMGTTRWNPTPEQLLALEEMYRRGIRTPTAEEIQQIAIQLSRFGKIEGKNVFYWFQNHKARERQKRRRELEAAYKLPKQYHNHTLPTMDTNDFSSSGLRTFYEVDQRKRLIHPSSCNEHYLEGSVSMHGTAESTIQTHGIGWSQFEERELYKHNNFSPKKKNATWHAMEWYTTARSSRMSNLERQQQSSSRFSNLDDGDEMKGYDEKGSEEVETLELFPLGSGRSEEEEEEDMNGNKKLEKNNNNNNTSSIRPKQYYEFLPLKK